MPKGIDSKLDKAWSEFVKKRAGMKCEYCGNAGYINAHHVFGRRNRAVRWNVSNGIALCAGCHTFSSKFSAHQTPSSFTLWAIGERGEEWHDDLMALASASKKWTKEEKEQLLKELRGNE